MKNKPAPLLNPGTLKPMTARELGGVFCLHPQPAGRHHGLMEATSVEQTSVFEAAEH